MERDNKQKGNIMTKAAIKNFKNFLQERITLAQEEQKFFKEGPLYYGALCKASTSKLILKEFNIYSK